MTLLIFFVLIFFFGILLGFISMKPIKRKIFRSKDLGEEVVLFEEDETKLRKKYKIDLLESVLYGYENDIGVKSDVDEVDNKPKIQVLAGEMSDNLFFNQILFQHFNIEIISGPETHPLAHLVFKNLKHYSASFIHYTLSDRPSSHFIIFDNSHLYIESPHASNVVLRKSVGIKNANKTLMAKYQNYYQKLISESDKDYYNRETDEI